MSKNIKMQSMIYFEGIYENAEDGKYMHELTSIINFVINTL